MKPPIEVFMSPVAGRGVRAIRFIRKGERIIKYRGRHMTWPEALEVHPHDPEQPNHTFIFDLGDGTVIDGFYGRCAAKYINHACDPNCESDIDPEIGEVWIFALRDIKPGEELFFDYRLELEDEWPTPELMQQHVCYCGSSKCRGTMLNIDLMRQKMTAKRAAAKKAAAKRGPVKL